MTRSMYDRVLESLARSSLPPLLLVALLAGTQFNVQAAAQDLNVAQDLSITELAFSSDGRVLHAIGEAPALSSSEEQHVRAVTYDAQTGAVLHVINFRTGTEVHSITSDGKTAVLTDHGILVFLGDTETGRTQPLPASWWNAKDDEPYVEFSADGRLISLYSESGAAPMTVTVYAWPARTFVARQTSDWMAAGGTFGGGVTPDGRAIQFESNRTGTKLVDPKTGRQMASFGPDTVLSPNGAWAVEMPDLSFHEDAPRSVLIKDGRTGQARGRINVPVPDDIAYGQMTGAFCGERNRFVLASGEGVAVYAIPSGSLLVSFPQKTWRDPAADVRVPVACSDSGGQVAILSGNRLSLHTAK